MVSCGTRYCDPDGEEIYSIVLDQKQVQEGLSATKVENVCGPQHGSVVFRRDAYHKVGGYRAQFNVTQDLDLWFRLHEVGGHKALTEIFYQAMLSPDSISFTNRKLQTDLTKLVVEAAELRNANLDERQVLEQVNILSAKTKGTPSPSKYYYFVGSCLRRTCPKKAKKYFLDSLKANPFHIKSWLRYIQT